MNISLELIEIEEIIPHEDTDSLAIDILLSKIKSDGYWSNPIAIDKNTRIIMDGHHRVEVARKMGIRRIPCYLLSYEDNYISVVNWKTNDIFEVKKILETAITGNKLPVKTTRHIITIPLYYVKIDLNILSK
ncbi:ParB N-terminal domain-containing protein [Fluviispira multicolorata]|uniref:ParB-like N-terminal domain-containing protein n=1 Tax=Fluviispira multicolorata TaxID=2654512 RepID=A0A833N5X0_9BACT|nr:ParB N-terminal domain-containing protein [Fluviispira multicolorata]KAB8028625.1 hypothetical protein GCL57_12970 [Fluviispira multicolorata]